MGSALICKQGNIFLYLAEFFTEFFRFCKKLSLSENFLLKHDFLKNQSNTTDRDSSEAASSIAAKKLERVLNKYIHTKDDKALLALWGSCAKSQNNVNWLYCQLMTDAAKLVCRACIGIFYRAVFLECQDSDS